MDPELRPDFIRPQRPGANMLKYNFLSLGEQVIYRRGEGHPGGRRRFTAKSAAGIA